MIVGGDPCRGKSLACYLVYRRDAVSKDVNAVAQIRTFDVLTDPYNVNLRQQWTCEGFDVFGRQRQLNAVSIGGTHC